MSSESFILNLKCAFIQFFSREQLRRTMKRGVKFYELKLKMFIKIHISQSQKITIT